LKNGADTLKRTQLELGGKNALIICEDADLDAAIAGAIKGMNLGWTAGQSCGSTSRVLVHSTHYEQVVNSISEKFNAIVPGHPALTNTQMGCLSTKGQYERVTGFITRAQNQGARIAAGGIDSSAPEKGYYVRPTLICDIGPEAEIANEEVFGPVLCVLPWHDESEMLNLVNALHSRLRPVTSGLMMLVITILVRLLVVSSNQALGVKNVSKRCLPIPRRERSR
jgi:betaine-aldehyde dehydrogenase